MSVTPREPNGQLIELMQKIKSKSVNMAESISWIQKENQFVREQKPKLYQGSHEFPGKQIHIPISIAAGYRKTRQKKHSVF
jgi:hypothetical protein